ncbi:peptidase M23 [Anopheles sinensis]|uniref:Peptidase M23 n=1 Tax=Anopheles sinensis TaxID=74873 RepID=A0A084VMM2_ANOSI|nr:peptidase M23 [Anopheles sinensis]
MGTDRCTKNKTNPQSAKDTITDFIVSVPLNHSETLTVTVIPFLGFSSFERRMLASFASRRNQTRNGISLTFAKLTAEKARPPAGEADVKGARIISDSLQRSQAADDESSCRVFDEQKEDFRFSDPRRHTRVMEVCLRKLRAIDTELPDVTLAFFGAKLWYYTGKEGHNAVLL